MRSIEVKDKLNNSLENFRISKSQNGVRSRNKNIKKTFKTHVLKNDSCNSAEKTDRSKN